MGEGRQDSTRIQTDGFGASTVRDLFPWAMERLQQEAEAGSVRQSKT